MLVTSQDISEVGSSVASGKLVVHTDSPDETRTWGRRLGERLQAGDFVALCGPLGAGKTCFVQGLGQGLGISSPITSPTFILIRQHPGPVPLCHADAYRVASAEELEDAGLTDCLADSVVALEWADRVPQIWPEALYIVQIALHNDGRRLELSARGRRPTEALSELADAYSGN